MRFVTPEKKRYQLANGTDWIEVWKELSVGQDKKYRMRGLKRMHGIGQAAEDVKVEVDWEVLPLARVEAYLADWSEKRALSRSAIEALAEEDFEEIDGIILRHIQEMADAKKATTGSETTPQP